MNNNWITFIVIISVILLAISLLAIKHYYFEEPNIEDVKCISDKITYFYQTGCHACIKQEKIFGESYSMLNKINCIEQGNDIYCASVGIVGTPTWILNGTIYEGVHSIKELKEITNC